jgi:hypothetical protein
MKCLKGNTCPEIIQEGCCDKGGRSLVGWRKRRIKIDLSLPDQRLDAGQQSRVGGLYAKRIEGDVDGYKAEKLAKHGIVHFAREGRA